MPVVTTYNSGSGTYPNPGAGTLVIECWGGGGYGDSGGLGGGGLGGGGGGYAATEVTLTGTEVIEYEVGVGGDSLSPTGTFSRVKIDTVAVARANAGQGGISGGGGGPAVTGDVQYDGGDGGTGGAGPSGGGGGGGESAGPNGNGNNGSNASGSSGGAGGTGNADAGDGGAGGDSGVGGSNGVAPGGGGGGGGATASLGGDGAAGRVRFTYTAPTPAPDDTPSFMAGRPVRNRRPGRGNRTTANGSDLPLPPEIIQPIDGARRTRPTRRGANRSQLVDAHYNPDDAQTDSIEWIGAENRTRPKRRGANRSQLLAPLDFPFNELNVTRQRVRVKRLNRSELPLPAPELLVPASPPSVKPARSRRGKNRSDVSAWLDWLPYGWGQVGTANVRRPSTVRRRTVDLVLDVVPFVDVASNRRHAVRPARRSEMLVPAESTTRQFDDVLTFQYNEYVEVYYMTNRDQQFEFVRYSDYSLRLSSATAIDTTGWSLTLTIRAMDDTLILQRSTPTDLYPINLATGVYQTDILSAVTTLIDEGEYKWDLWRTDSGDAQQLAQGFCRCLGQVRTVS